MVQLSSAQPRRIGIAWLTASTTPALLGLLVALLAVPAAAIALSRGFDGLYGQDAYAYFDYGTTSVRNSLLHLAPLEPFFWPPGYPILVALASLPLGTTPLAGQLVSLVLGALVPLLTALVARELWPRDPAWLPLLAGGMVAVCGQLWQSSVVVMSDTTGLALATFSAWALLRYALGHRGGWLVAASAAIAWATLARWIYGLVAIPFAIYALMILLAPADSRRPIALSRALLHVVMALAVAAMLLVPLLAPSLLALRTHPDQPAAFAGNFQVYSWSPLNAFRRDFLTADGHLAYALPNGVYYAIAPANLAFLGPLLAVWILPGLWAARHWPARDVVLIVGWAALVFAFHAGAPWQNFRFALAYLPPLAILSAAGVLLAVRWSSTFPRLRLVIAACAVLGVIVSAGDAARLVERFIDAKDQELALVRWVESQTPPNAQLFSFGPTLTFRHYSNLPTFDLYDLAPDDVQAVLDNPAPEYVLVDTRSIESQWLNQAPWRNFHLLGASPGLVELGSSEGYTLFQVVPRAS